MKIRVATQADMQAIADLHAVSWRENYYQVLSAEFLKDKLQQERLTVWQTRFAQPESNQLILVAEGEDISFCGFICAFGDFDPLYGTIIDNLHVKSDLKGKGIGGQLLKAAANWANEQHGENGLYLEVLKINRNAEAFYKSKGAIKLGAKVWHTPCGNLADEYLYGWKSPADYLERNQ